MYVKCIRTDIANRARTPSDLSSLTMESRDIHITVGKEYLVYAIEYDWFSYLVYYICDDNYSIYPACYPADLFEVSDHRIPGAWIFAQWNEERLVSAGLYAEEWAKDRYFYDSLTDAEPAAVSLWWRIKERIEENSI